MGNRLVKNTSKRFKDDQAERIWEEIEVAVATEFKGKSTQPCRKKIMGRGREIQWCAYGFVPGIEMIIMIETFRNVREVLSNKNYKVNREIVRAHLELSLKENPLGKAQAMF